MTDSILGATKKKLGIADDYTHFDLDIETHINTAFFTLHQLKVGTPEVFQIDGDTETWDDFFKGQTDLNAVKTYVYLKVRLLFDPPTTSFTIASMEKQVEELGWRLNVAAESKLSTNGGSADLWNLTNLEDFPPEAEEGDLGVNLATGDVWRNG